MNFIPWDLSNILQTLELLQPESRPLWGNFSAQHMVEHLCGGLKMSMGKIKEFSAMLAKNTSVTAPEILTKEDFLKQ